MNLLLNGLILKNSNIGMSASKSDDTKQSRKTVVIHEVYDGGNAPTRFEYELECALEAKADYIVIEPTKLGEETSRWIRVGNCLHKTAVISGLCSLCLPHILPEGYPPAPSICIGVPTALISLGCAALYGISWQFDPCCKYQVTVNSRELSELHVQNLTNASPVVLVRKDDKYRKALHNSIALTASIVMVRALWQFWHS